MDGFPFPIVPLLYTIHKKDKGGLVKAKGEKGAAGAPRLGAAMASLVEDRLTSGIFDFMKR